MNKIGGFDLIETLNRGLIVMKIELPIRINSLNKSNPEMAAKEQEYLDRVNFILNNPMILHQLAVENISRTFPDKNFFI